MQCSVINERNHAALCFSDVSLKIPIYSNASRSITTSLVNSVTGGNLYKSSSGCSVLALNNINCSIMEGDKVGLIGHNGSGKTTFLRIASSILRPSKGSFTSSLAVSPLINRGFITSSELSGLEATKAHYLHMHKSFIGFESFLQEVIDFSGLGEYIYLPIKGYSDGMRSRLMFTLVTSFEHECLAIDEGFGSGDLSFFRQARRRLRGFIDSAGTLLFATHSHELMRKFCSRGLVFDKGSIVYDGPIESAFHYSPSGYV